MRFLILLLIPMSLQAAEGLVCVRNYITEKGNACDTTPFGYKWVTGAAQEGQKVCVRSLAPAYCGSSKEFKHVESEDGKAVCVTDFDQEPILNYCKSYPTLYTYVDELP